MGVLEDITNLDLELDYVIYFSSMAILELGTIYALLFLVTKSVSSSFYVPNCSWFKQDIKQKSTLLMSCRNIIW